MTYDVHEDDSGLWTAAQSGRVLARLRVQHGIGRELPRFWYHVGRVVHAAASLGLFREQHTLLLGNDLTGASELTDIEGDRAAPAALTALLAAVRQRHADRHLIVELPGLRDSADQSPFWSGLGRHFYAGDPRDAAERFGPAWRSHVAALLPRQLVYTSFLPEAAQAAIGATPPQAAAMRAALEAAGFRWQQHVAIDDGGAVLEWLPLPAAGEAPPKR